MFNWFRRKPSVPPVEDASKSNPALAPVAILAHDDNRAETVDLVDSLERVMRDLGHSVARRENVLVHQDTGFIIKPGVVDYDGIRPRGMRTITTIEVRHPEVVPLGLFEYQESIAGSMTAAMEHGLRSWAELDLPTLLQTVRPDMKTCPTMEMTFPTKGTQRPRLRQGILGPVMFVRPESAEPVASTDADHGPHSPDCTCCLLTNSFTAFKDLFAADRFFAIRLFASRAENGRPDAACRINGVDWEPGKKALRKYAESWPFVGFEMRNQYILLHTPKGTS